MEPLAASVSMKKTTSRRSGEFVTTQEITNHFLAPRQSDPYGPQLRDPAPDEITWGIRALKVPELWEAGFRGEGVLIRISTLGSTQATRPLKSAIEHFAEFDWLGREVSPTPLARDTDTLTPGHGTHSAATIAGRPVRKGGRRRTRGDAGQCDRDRGRRCVKMS